MVVSSTNISMEWKAVNEIDENGIIIAYEITYTPLKTFGGAIGENKMNISGIFLSAVVEGLEEFVNYNLSVLAYTAVGGGPSSDKTTVVTLQSGKLDYVKFGLQLLGICKLLLMTVYQFLLLCDSLTLQIMPIV